ncbi:hypothetical protein JR316_0012953 [Psilocybe cubensis]|uniref:Uncharacterized protein n=2 Tax=Psilocybe cubensis TaxID=181762 RepID=A0A8H8CHW1_PSICU|nr:hypothetical protein JR316_0012953 [Psilocybe cubensis]KAH9474494.1 hypothetical protein JR316_0012953 [Psilocybe cubensis]
MYSSPINNRSRPSSPNPPYGHASPPNGPAGYPGYYGAPAPYGAPIGGPMSSGPPPNPQNASPAAGFHVEKRAKSPNPYGQPVTTGVYAPAPRAPISGGSPPVQQYYNQPTGGPHSRGPSPAPPGMAPRPLSQNFDGQGYYGAPSAYGAPIGRSASPNPHDASSGFQVEKRAKSPNPYGRPPTAQPEANAYRDEMVYREQISALLAAKSHQTAITGRIPIDPTQLSLFFRGKDGISYSLDFPIDTGYSAPPTLDVLVSICRPKREREALTYPPGLRHTTTLEISNHPVLETIRNILFSKFPDGHYLTAVRDSLDVAITGSYVSKNSPAHLRQDNRVATLLLTLPVAYRGGAIVVTDKEGREEKFLGNGGKPTEIEWVAFRPDSTYAVEPVQNGCMITISYALYLKTSGVANPTVDNLVTPSDKFFNLLSPILNNNRGRSIGFLLGNDYNVDPSEVVANSLIPQLKGGDALLYEAFKLHKLSPQLRWHAGGFVWPADQTLESFGDEDEVDARPMANMPAPLGRPLFGGPNAQGGDDLRAKVQSSGGVPLAEASIILITDPKEHAPVVGRERVFFVSKGELEKLVVNVLLVVYIP